MRPSCTRTSAVERSNRMHTRGHRSRCTWVVALPHLMTKENGDYDHQPHSASAPAARTALLPQIGRHSEHVHQLCGPCAVCVACAGCGARAVRCARCWLTCKCAGALRRLARSAERFRVASAVTPCRGCQRPRRALRSPRTC